MYVSLCLRVSVDVFLDVICERWPGLCYYMRPCRAGFFHLEYAVCVYACVYACLCMCARICEQSAFWHDSRESSSTDARSLNVKAAMPSVLAAAATAVTHTHNAELATTAAAAAARRTQDSDPMRYPNSAETHSEDTQHTAAGVSVSVPVSMSVCVCVCERRIEEVRRGGAS